MCQELNFYLHRKLSLWEIENILFWLISNLNFSKGRCFSGKQKPIKKAIEK